MKDVSFILMDGIRKMRGDVIYKAPSGDRRRWIGFNVTDVAQIMRLGINFESGLILRGRVTAGQTTRKWR